MYEKLKRLEVERARKALSTPVADLAKSHATLDPNDRNVMDRAAAFNRINPPEDNTEDLQRREDTVTRLIEQSRTGGVTKRESKRLAQPVLEPGPDGLIRVKKQLPDNDRMINGHAVRFTAKDLENYLLSTGNFSQSNVDTIVAEYLTHQRAIYHRGYMTQDNHVLHFNSDIVSEIKEKLMDMYKSYGRKTFNIQIGLGKLLFSQKDSAARFFYPSGNAVSTVLPQVREIKTVADVNSVVEEITSSDLGAALTAPRENSTYSGVMYTNFELYHSAKVARVSSKKIAQSVLNCCVEFPPWKRRDRTIVSHFAKRKSKSKKDGQFDDGLCMFRALALFKQKITSKKNVRIDDDFHALVNELVDEFVSYRQSLIEQDLEIAVDLAQETEDILVNGLPLNEIPILENCFDINIVLLEKNEKGFVSLIRDSCFRHSLPEDSDKILYLDLFEDHVSYIPSLARYSSVYKCPNCNYFSDKVANLRRHLKNRSGCSVDPIDIFPGGFYKRPLSVFEKIANALPEEHIDSEVCYPYMFCYDYESWHEKSESFDSIDQTIENDLQEGRGKTHYISKHRALSVSVSSNIPGFTSTVHFVNTSGEKALVQEKIDFMYEAQATAHELMREKYGEPLSKILSSKIEKLKEKAEKLDRDISSFDHGSMSEICNVTEDYIRRNKKKKKTNPRPRPSNRKRKRRRCNNDFLDNECGVDAADEDDEEEEGYDGDDGEEREEGEEEGEDEEGEENLPPSSLPPLESDIDPETSLPQLDNPRGEKLINMVPNYYEKEIEKLEGLIKELAMWCRQVPVLGFNSQKYDLRLVRSFIFDILSQDRDNPESQERVKVRIINGSKGFMSVDNSWLRFVDVTNWLAPGTNLVKFLEQSNCVQRKGLFPYEYITSIDVLKETSLPPPECWHSVLKGSNILGTSEVEIQENYQYMQKVWRDENMSSLFDLLRWYNNLDTEPMLEACLKLSQQFQQEGIDAFKQTISSPGVSLLLGMKYAEREGYRFPLINEQNKDLHYRVLDNIVGGPSIVFHPEIIAGETKIRDSDEVVEKCLGFDCNSMYPAVLQGFVPVNCWYRRCAEKNFRAERMDGFNMSAVEIEVLAVRNSLRARTGDPPIKTRVENGGKELSVCGVFVDGLAAPLQREENLESEDIDIIKNLTVQQRGKTVSLYDKEFKPTAFLVHGCYYHGCECLIKKKYEKFENSSNVEEKLKLAEQLRYLLTKRSETLIKEDVLTRGGYFVDSIYECQWKEETSKINFNSLHDIKSKIKPWGVLNYGTKENSLTEEKIIELLKEPFNEETGEGLYGLVRCDVSIPESQHHKWKDLAPLFINATITEDDLTEYQKERFKTTPAYQNGTEVKIKKKLLVDCLQISGGHALFTTDYLRWLVSKGARIDKIYEIFESCVGKPFEKYITNAVEKRKAGDVAKKELGELRKQLEENRDNLSPAEIHVLEIKITECNTIIATATIQKIIINSLFGKFMENKTRQEQVEIVHGLMSSCIAASKPGTKRNIEIDADLEMFEIHRSKLRLKWNNPLIHSLFTLQNSKKIFLMFVHDFLYRFHNRKHIMGGQMDTDAYYCAISRPTLRDILFTRDEFENSPQLMSEKGFSSYEDYLKEYDEKEKVFLSLCDKTLRTPGLFKLEWSGRRLIALGSKTYAGDDGQGGGLKFSAKGVQARLNRDLLTVDNYKKVLDEGGVKYAKHSGFRLSTSLTGGGRFQGDNSAMTTYKGSKIGLNGGSFFKRKVHPDGTTEPHKRAFQVEKCRFFDPHLPPLDILEQAESSEN